MKIDVRWVYQRQANGGGAQKASLCLLGKRHVLCVAAGPPVRVLKRPLADIGRARPAYYPGTSTPVAATHAATRLMELGEQKGITDSARRLLRLALDPSARFVDGLEDEIEDEEALVTQYENPEPVAGTSTDHGNGQEMTMHTETVTTKDKTVTKAKAKAKAAKAAPAKAKAAPTKAAPTKAAPAKERKPRPNHAKLPKTKSDGPTPFRAGTAKEKAFLLYKEQRAKYAAMSKEEKGEWADKHAQRLGISPGTLRSWIGGQFNAALNK